jgi:two-component system NtrC family response regulator
LYYRLAVVVLKLPALRERGGDKLMLAQAFLQKFGKELGKESIKFNRETLRAIEQHSWPGNVRELENRIKRGVIMAEGALITKADLELEEVATDLPGKTLKEAREEVERVLILEALQRHKGKISPAAADLGISRPTFYELMDKLGVKRDE